MGHDWILALTDRAGIVLPLDELEDDWRAQVHVYLFASNLSRKSIKTARTKLGSATNSIFSGLEIELFASGVRLEDIFVRRFALCRTVARPLGSIEGWRRAGDCVKLMEKHRSSVLELLKLQCASLQQRQAAMPPEKDSSSHASPETIRYFVAERPELFEPRWGGPMERYLSPRRPSF